MLREERSHSGVLGNNNKQTKMWCLVNGCTVSLSSSFIYNSSFFADLVQTGALTIGDAQTRAGQVLTDTASAMKFHDPRLMSEVKVEIDMAETPHYWMTSQRVESERQQIKCNSQYSVVLERSSISAK